MRTLTRKEDAYMYLHALVTSAGLDALAGAWLFASALLFHRGADPIFINNLACGALAVVLAFGGFAHVFMAWLPAAVGAWVIVSPLMLGFTDNTIATANNVVTGIVIFILAVKSYTVSKTAHNAGMSAD